MSYDYIIEYKHLVETPVPGKPLGRHVRHDSRSKAYALAEGDPDSLVKVDWSDSVLLDQGQLGSCTGNASVGALGTSPNSANLPAGTVLDENLAVKVYSLATTLDSYSGSYPPDDTGSDGLSAAKAVQQLGFINGYQHALSLNAALTALQKGPVITGVSWYSGFDNPDGNGLVHKTGSVRGGHEFVVVGYDPATNLVKARNSWGPSFGLNGYFYFSASDWDALLKEQGDVTQFVPLGAPAPTPTPTPTPVPTPTPTPTPIVADAADRTFASNATFCTRMSKAYKAWKAVKGL